MKYDEIHPISWEFHLEGCMCRCGKEQQVTAERNASIHFAVLEVDDCGCKLMVNGYLSTIHHQDTYIYIIYIYIYLYLYSYHIHLYFIYHFFLRIFFRIFLLSKNPHKSCHHIFLQVQSQQKSGTASASEGCAASHQDREMRI